MGTGVGVGAATGVAVALGEDVGMEVGFSVGVGVGTGVGFSVGAGVGTEVAVGEASLPQAAIIMARNSASTVRVFRPTLRVMYPRSTSFMGLDSWEE